MSAGRQGLAQVVALPLNPMEVPSVRFPQSWFALAARLEAVDALRSAYIVGGFVRDLVLGRRSRDVDIAIGADAAVTAQVVADILDARAVVLDAEREITRVIWADGNDTWYIDIAALNGGIDTDLRRRDFTIDAMAVSWRVATEGRFIALDPCDGLGDLQRRLVRVTSAKAFGDDPLRLLRGVRLAAELGFEIEEWTACLIARNASLLATVARERVTEELSRILVSSAAVWLKRLDGLGLLTVIIPELEAAKGVAQPPEHFWNVFDHMLATVTATEALLHEPARDSDWPPAWAVDVAPWGPALEAHFNEVVGGGRNRRQLLKLAALLHDVSKPETKKVQPSGRIRFLGHPEEGSAVAATIMERLRFSSREISLVERMVAEHMRAAQLTSEEGGPTRRAVYRYFRDLGDAAIDTLFLSLADHMAARGPRLEPDEWRRHAEAVAQLIRQHLERQAATPPVKLIDGYVIMQRFGLAPGPIVGELLDRVDEARATGEVSTKEEALDLVAAELASRRKG